MNLLREYIRGLVVEMAYIDDPIHPQDPEVMAAEEKRRARLKGKRAKPPGNWKKVLSVLQVGGYIMEPIYGKSYHLVDVNDKTLGKIHNKTVDELFQSGFLEYEDEGQPDSLIRLSDEGRGYL